MTAVGLEEKLITTGVLGATFAAAFWPKALQVAKAEARALSDQLRQARADLDRLGIADQNRTLISGALSGALGVLCGIGIGMSLRRKS